MTLAIETRKRVTGIGPIHPAYIALLATKCNAETQEVSVGVFPFRGGFWQAAAIVEKTA
ncbi:hypothetical protein [Brevundimonas sp.]|jgi:hypothetical protein|uniref:hypothetical protein n=1 Tax=Brevundimonas sp. TaxID=1871086 RepID=UPI003785209F